MPPVPNYRSLTPGGFFSADPNNLAVKRSIRTNNPGALNISAWQKTFPGYVGTTKPDSAGNVTAVYVTPEHGIAAWHYLLTDRYKYGAKGTLVLKDLAKRYAGATSDTDPAVKSYLAGWKKWSGNTLNPADTLRLADDGDMVKLARAMFGHEIGKATPLHDDQVTTALALKRSGTLPPN